MDIELTFFFRHSTIHCINDRINLPRCGLTDIGSWAYKLFWALGSGLRLRCRVKLFQSRLSEVVGPPPISSAEYGSQSLSRTCRARTHLQAFSLSLSLWHRGRSKPPGIMPTRCAIGLRGVIRQLSLSLSLHLQSVWIADRRTTRKPS